MLWALTIITLLGSAMLALGFCGRVAARGVFCRRCRFDLAGLDRSASDAICPECGAMVGANPTGHRPGRARTRSVIRRTRVWTTLVGASILLVGVVGLGLLQAKSPGLYPRLPEGVLGVLDRLGEPDALAELDARLRAETLSDESIAAAARRALAISDSNRPWDTRRGDAITEAMIRGLLTTPEIHEIAERAFDLQIEARPQIGSGESVVYFRAPINGNPRLASSLVGNGALAKARSTVASRLVGAGMESPFRVNITREQPWISKPPPAFRNRPGGQAYLRNWSPLATSYLDSPTLVRIPADTDGAFEIHLSASFELVIDGQPSHTWQQSVTTRVERAEPSPVYSAPILVDYTSTTPSPLAEYARQLQTAFIQVPIDRELGRPHKGTGDAHWARSIHLPFASATGLDPGVAVLFDIVFRDSTQEIPLMSYHGFADRLSSFEVSRSQEPNMLDYFDRHAAFWDRAVERGAVDLILRPSPDLAVMDPRYTRHIGETIIFRDVPIMLLVPRDMGPERRAPSGAQWDWVQADPKPYSIVHGELLDAD